MGFRTEETNFEYSVTNRNVNDKLKLNIVSDTINPSTPKKVEGTVSTTTSVQQNTVEEKQEDTPQEPIKVTQDAETTAEEQHQEQASTTQQEQHAADTTARAKPRVAVSSDISVSDNVSATTTSELPTLAVPTSITPSALAIREQYLQDSIARMDSINLAQAIAIRKHKASYSYVEHKEGTNMPIKLDRSDGIFILLLVCFLLLAHIYNGGVAFFKENIMLVFSASKSEKLETQTTSKELFYSYFLVFLAILLISISLYEGFDRFMPLVGEEKRPFVTIGLFAILISVFLLLKMIFNKFIGFIFDFGKRIATWNQSYLVLLSILGLLCFLPTLLLVYSNFGHSIIIGFVLILFLIVQIILFFRLIIFFIEQKFNFLYLIAYLCAVEILPYIFLGIGLVYLYKIDIFNTIL